MADKTTNYNLTKPSAEDFYDVDVQNGNMDTLDAALHAHESDTAKHNSATEKGGALGDESIATSGGAMGCKAKTNAGGAVGYLASSNSGGSMGYMADTQNGGAIGEEAKTNNGGAVGYKSKTSHGCAIGHQAVTAKEDGTLIDAIQLGMGTNTEEKSMQVYGYKLMNPDGTIPTERLTKVARITGSYVGDDLSTRSIAIGGEGGLLHIYSDGISYLITPVLGVHFTNPLTITVALTFKDGVLRMTNDTLNQKGVTYKYAVL